MKIVNIILNTRIGGMEQASLRLMQALKERGHAFQVVSLNPVGLMAPLLEESGIPVTGMLYRGKWGWRSFYPLKKILRSIEADAVLMTGTNLMAMLAIGHMCPGRRVLAIHACHLGDVPPWQWRLIYRVACQKFQAITFPSEFTRDEADALYSPVKKIARILHNPLVIPNLPTLEERESARRSFGLPADAAVVGNSARLVPGKRMDIFLKVAQNVLKEAPHAWFLVAGDGEDRSKLEALARELGISERIKWLGWQQNLVLFYSALDVMLFNSDEEAMGLSPLEALSYGVPLVASVLQGGLKEIVSQDDFGFLIAAHDVGALSKKTIYFLKNKEAGRKTALAGRDRVAHFTHLGSIAETMESLLQGSRGVAKC